MAGNRPADWHVLDLDKDPTPGDPDRVRNLAKNLHDFADDVSKVLRDIKGMAGEDAILTWAGKTAESFTSEFEDAPGKLKKLKKSYEMAGDALSTYWPELERAQALADKALVKGREAQGDLSSAQTRLTSADSWVDKAGKEADKYKDDKDSGKDVPKPDPDKVKAATRNATAAEKAQTAAKSDVSAAKSNLDAAKKMAEDARKMRENAAGTAKKKLEEASDAGIQNRKWWEEVGDWVTDNWDTIVAVCKVVVAVLGVIAMIIGGPILGAIVLIAALVVLADTLHKYANGEAGLLDVAFAALDCIPGMKGLTSLRGLAKGMKGLKAGLKGFKSARSALTSGAKGAFNRLKSKIKGCGDPVDVATGRMFLDAVDVTLPGTLPLVFTRRVTSGYRTGGWFGSSWTSTIDQRLEIDEYGVVFVTEDGMLLAYPHPEGSDAAVLPESGPCWPLERLDGGGYRITDTVTGLRRYFTPPTDDVALLARISDRNDNTIDIEHDAEGTPLAMRHSGGYHLKLTVEDERVTALDLAGAGEHGDDVTIKRYGYTGGNLTHVTNSSGRALEFGYDERLRITSWVDTNGSRYDYAYDEQDRCVAQRGIAGHLANTFTYDVTDPAWPDFRTTTVTSGEGHTSRFVVDGNCLVVAEIDPLGNAVHSTYDNLGHVKSRTDGMGITSSFVNDQAGRPLEVVGPDSSITRFTYNELGHPTKITLPDASVWARRYDARGNCVEVIGPSGSTRFSYDAHGRPTSIVDTHGAETRIRCNTAGLPIEVTDPLGHHTTQTYDPFGRPAESVDAVGGVTELAWTIEGQLARRTAPDGTSESWLYDGEGNCVRHDNAAAASTLYEYSHFDVMTARTDPDGSHYTFGYDSSLRLSEVINPLGLTWSYAYDAAGRLLSETDFDGRELRYTYDSAGRLSSRTNPMGQSICYERNALGQMTRKDAAGQVTTFEYDALGNLATAVGPEAVVSLHRDRTGALTAETVNGRTMTYGYDLHGRRTSRTTPTGATSVWSYDTAGNRVRLATAGHTIDILRDAMGRETKRLIDKNISLGNTFDPLGRLTVQTVSAGNGRSLQKRVYGYRDDGHVVSVEDQLNGTRRFDLDESGRVVAVDAATWTERYAYDGAGNQVSAEWPERHPGQEAVGQRTYHRNQIVRAGRLRYEYDRAGRVTLRQKTRISRGPDTWRYSWDAEDRLTSVITPTGERWRYQYDPMGRRMAKQQMSPDGETILTEVEFSWEGTTLCEQTTRSAGRADQLTVTWDHEGLHPVAQTERISTRNLPQEAFDQRFFTIVSDLVGSPTELIDESGDIAWRTRRATWGITTWNAEATTYTPLRFPGQYFDPETGLHYNHFRYYDPESARYLSPDPLGLSPAPNPAAYVGNPLTESDPLGLAPCREFFTVQSPTDAARLRRGGEPWPGEMHRAHFGEGVYSWASRSDAERYFGIKSRRTDELEIVRFTIPEADFAKLRKTDISKMTDDQAQTFIDRYSLMSDTGVTDHGFQYITRPTNLGSEHFFSKDVMHLLNFD